MNLKPALVVFDMAGTTVGDDGCIVSQCLQAALKAGGIEVSIAEVNVVMGYPKPDAIRRLIDGEATDPALVESIHQDFVQRMLAYYREDPTVAPIPGAEATFAHLRKSGIRVALDTGFSRLIADVILDRLGWSVSETFDATITSDEVERGRPFPDMILRLMERFEISQSDRVAKVGDTPSDLLEGTSAGCGWVIGVTGSGTHDAAQLAAYPHTHLVPSVADLPALLEL